MKTSKNIQIIALLAGLFFLHGCGERLQPIEIGEKGYGKTTLANGITVLVNHDASTALTGARILIGGGVLTETAENNGITNIMTKMLLKGNDVMTASEITERLDFLGASVSVTCYRDYSVITFASLTENFDEVMDIISRSVAAPTFPEEELAKLKQEIEGNIRASDDSQSQASNKLFWKTAYGNQGYGLPTLGTAESISSITAEQIQKHYDEYVGGANIIFSVATDLPADRVLTLAHSKLGTIKADARQVAAPPPNLQPEKTGFISFERNQSFVFMGVALDRLEATDVAYVALLNEIMGNNVGARLWYLRQKEKLAYAIYTTYDISRYCAAFRAAIGTDTAKVQTALAALDREWKRLVDDGITADELADAKINLKNNIIPQIESKSSRASYMAYYEYLGLGHRFVLDLFATVDDISVEQVNRFVGERFTEDRRFTSIVGKR